MATLAYIFSKQGCGAGAIEWILEQQHQAALQEPGNRRKP